VESCDRHEQIAAAARIYATALLDVDRVAIALALSAKRIIDLNPNVRILFNRTAIALKTLGKISRQWNFFGRLAFTPSATPGECGSIRQHHNARL
jgi:hypothetical protein